MWNKEETMNNFTNIHIAAIAGSLRKNSFNKKLLQSAVNLLPENTSFEILDLSDLPMYNWDLERSGLPDPVVQFRNRLQAADALLIATPEYNYSIPGVLKNALDWASRSHNGQPNPLSGKPLAMMGAGGRAGTARAQNHLRQIASHLNMFTINKPEVLIAMPYKQGFDASGELTDPMTLDLVQALLNELIQFTRRLQGIPDLSMMN